MNERREGAKLVEVFHLAFLQVLPSHLPVRDYAIKGGANLRLFFDSRRRSQDIDIDYLGNRPDELEAKVDQTLSSRAFRDLLRVGGVVMSDPTKPKQTETTRRWKFAVDGPGAHLNTKVEFSGREHLDPERAFDAARGDLGRGLGLRMVKAEHYLAPAAIRQKIRALAQRSESEPRDVFDLDLLFGQHPDALAPESVAPELLKKAADAVLSIPYEAYRELVVEFVEEDFVEIYGRPEVWTDMALGVVDRLEALR
jgi:hypothetical protein